MATKFDKEQFVALAKEIKADLNIDVNTVAEMEKFQKQNPEKYQVLLNKVKAAVELSVSGGSFDQLSAQDMEALQGAGDTNAETTPLCITAGVTAGLWISSKLC